MGSSQCKGKGGDRPEEMADMRLSMETDLGRIRRDSPPTIEVLLALPLPVRTVRLLSSSTVLDVKKAAARAHGLRQRQAPELGLRHSGQLLDSAAAPVLEIGPAGQRVEVEVEGVEELRARGRRSAAAQAPSSECTRQCGATMVALHTELQEKVGKRERRVTMHRLHEELQSKVGRQTQSSQLRRRRASLLQQARDMRTKEMHAELKAVVALRQSSGQSRDDDPEEEPPPSPKAIKAISASKGMLRRRRARLAEARKLKDEVMREKELNSSTT